MSKQTGFDLKSHKKIKNKKTLMLLKRNAFILLNVFGLIASLTALTC